MAWIIDVVDGCLSQTYTPSYSSEDNQHCECLGQFKSEDALRSNYMNEAIQRGIPSRKNLAWGPKDWECKEPMYGNFNPYPGAEIDKRADSGDSPG